MIFTAKNIVKDKYLRIIADALAMTQVYIAVLLLDKSFLQLLVQMSGIAAFRLLAFFPGNDYVSRFWGADDIIDMRPWIFMWELHTVYCPGYVNVSAVNVPPPSSFSSHFMSR